VRKGPDDRTQRSDAGAPDKLRPRNLLARAIQLDQHFAWLTFPHMNRPIAVKALGGGRIAVRFSDGAEGIIDMSESIGRGIFAPLQDPSIFAQVYIGDHGQIAWSEEMEICPDGAYLEVAGQTSREAAHA
jgi:hypothetical protein